MLNFISWVRLAFRLMQVTRVVGTSIPCFPLLASENILLLWSVVVSDALILPVDVPALSVILCVMPWTLIPILTRFFDAAAAISFVVLWLDVVSCCG